MKKHILKMSIGAVIGGALGFAYYYFIGCKSGSCPLTGNPYISSLYGAAMGLLLTMPGTKRTETNQES